MSPKHPTRLIPAERAADICWPTRCIEADLRNYEVLEIFNTDAKIQILPVVKAGEIIGLINRERFMGAMAGRFHWEIYSKKRCTKMMEHDPLVVDAAASIAEVANQLLQLGKHQALPERFIIADQGNFAGVGNTSDVLATLLRQQETAVAELQSHRDDLAATVRARTYDLELAKLAAEHANQAKTEFLSNMSHELRTPLHAVLAMAEIGSQKSQGATREKLAKYFSIINESAIRLSQLINDLLDVAELESGRVDLNPAQLDLCIVIARVVSELSNLAAQADVTLHTVGLDQPAPCRCDAERIHQVMRNVLGNALKFSPAGTGIRIQLEAPGATAADDYLIRISDQGPGIPENELEGIFESFTQSSQTRTGAGGRGLGLPICREIMRLHGGRITASNNAAGGACFLIRLPPASGR